MSERGTQTMADGISIGDKAPNFDLSSTEDALLMLQDEVPRHSVLLYFFADPASDRVRRDLQVLARLKDSLARAHAKILGISRAKMPALKELQAELQLPFPLLRDDRDFSSQYGVEPAGEDEEAQPALCLVSRQQIILWMANPVTSVEDALPQVKKALSDQGSPTANYPKTVINRLVDRWVN